MLVEAVLTGAVAGGTSILYATVGETVAERSGVINLGTEGSMLCGALAAYAAGIATGNPWFGVLAGLLAGAALAGVHALVTLGRGANQIATGLVVTFLGIGLTGLFGQEYVKQGVVGFKNVAIPGLSSIPFFGPILFNHDPLTYLSFIVAPLAWWILFSTRPGLWVRTAGERAEVLHTFGTSPVRVRASAAASWPWPWSSSPAGTPSRPSAAPTCSAAPWPSNSSSRPRAPRSPPSCSTPCRT
jgi:ABC-type uncharacterized transport system permease subunit